MEKKTYQKPTIELVEIENSVSILAGSLGVTDKPASGTIVPLSLEDDEDVEVGEIILPKTFELESW